MKKFSVLIFTFVPLVLYAGNRSSVHSLWGIFKLGGIWMWFLLILSIIALAFILERIYYFHKAKINSKQFMQRFMKLKLSKEILMKFISNDDSLIAKIINNSIDKNIKQDEFEKRVERETSIEVNELGRGLNIIASIGSLAPLLGFLGTVAGMIRAFGNIAAADEVSASLVANGIYTALLTTAFGLIIAIPTIAIYNYFVHRIDNFIADVEKVVNIILNNDILKR